MNLTSYTAAKFMCGGVELPMRKIDLAVVDTVVYRKTLGSYSVDLTLNVEAKSKASAFDFLLLTHRGATNETLAKRVVYGGRKGRSAMRRLLDRGFVGVLTVNGGPALPSPPFTVTTRDGSSYTMKGRRRR